MKQRNISVIALASVAMLGISSPAFDANLPATPLLFDVPYEVQAGATINVPSGGNLQTALDNAKLGDTIVLQAGATYSGSFKLPNKTTGTGWIYIRSSAYSNLPPPGTRVSPANAANMATIAATAGDTAAILTAPGAHHIRFVGIELRPVSGNFLYNVIWLGNQDTTIDGIATHLTFDRCYIHGDPTVGSRRGIFGNAAYVAVVDSYFADFKEPGADTQAFAAVSSPGPFKLVNNYLEAAGENMIFGGGQPTVEAFIPADIEIRDNLVVKPASWLGASWSVKNLLEFKLGIRALVYHNRFENNWAASQQGFAVLLTPRNEFNSFPQAVVKDITIVGNQFINVAQGIHIAGIDDGDGVPGRTSQRTNRVLIKDNFIDVTMHSISGLSDGRIFMILGGPIDVTIDHNTAFTLNQGSSSALVLDSLTAANAERFTFTNNIISNGRNSCWGSGVNTCLAVYASAYVSNAIMTNNAFVDIAFNNFDPSQFPAGNFFPANIGAVGFVDPAAGNYQLAANSLYKGKGTDGRDLGAATTGVVVTTVSLPTTRAPTPPKVLQVQ
jgi:hypothetical protein